MAATSFNDAVSKDIRRCRFILLSAALGIVVLILPLQHYQTLGRYQHYALGVAVCGLGYFVQLTWSYPKLTPLGRFCHLITGLFLEAVAYVLWTNPWLDWRVAVQTESRDPQRIHLLLEYMVSVSFIWICWLWLWIKEMRTKKKIADAAGAEVKSP
jgi:hypothetical protein